MKKMILAFAVLFLGILTTSSAQIPGLHASVGMARGRQILSQFRSDFCGPQGSFIIKAYDDEGGGIGDYLLGTYPTLENAYLHVYFGFDKAGQDDIYAPTLIVTGAKLKAGSTKVNARLSHDRNRGGFWALPMRDKDCGIPFDCDLDQTNHNVHMVVDISNLASGIVDNASAATTIRNFQAGNDNEWAGRKRCSETESFLLCANDVRAYLRKYPEVVYLQFFIGYRAQGNCDNLTILMTGIDPAGHHIWSKDDEGFSYVFDKAVACPGCSIDHDSRVDYHRQSGN
jgi:hypothetical protein